MKTLVRNLFVAFIASITLVCAPAHAQYTTQLEEKSFPVGDFSSINVTDNFEVTLEKGSCGVKLTVDKVLMPYVQVYVRSKVLYITYDNKSVPKDVKQLFKGRGAPSPVLRAVVTMPEVASVSLSDGAHLNSTVQLPSSGFVLKATDKAQVKHLWLDAKGEASVELSKSVQADLNLQAESRLHVSAEGSSVLTLIASGKEVALACAGSSRSSAEIKKCESVSLEVTGSSNLVLTGEAVQTSVRGEKGAEVDAQGFTTQKLEANLASGCKVSMSVKEQIAATLVGGSSLYYWGEPTFQIGKIMKSTLAPAGSTSK